MRRQAYNQSDITVCYSPMRLEGHAHGLITPVVLALGQDVNSTARIKIGMSTEYTRRHTRRHTLRHSLNYHTLKSNSLCCHR